MKVPYFTPWITTEDKKFLLKTLSQRWLTNGPILQKFENKFSSFIGSNFSLGVSSATHALHLALKAVGIGPGDEVIVPTLTFTSTSDAVRYCGAKPILVDVDIETFNISTFEIKRKVSNKTKVIIPVHYGGQACDMNEITAISKNYGLKIIEDCAHSLGSTYEKLRCGNIGDMGCFSFYPTKIITTGEGGMITIDDSKILKKIKLLRSHGMNKLPSEREKLAQWKYDIIELGYNYRLDEIRASLGYSQFRRINRINKLRIKIAKKYDIGLKKIKGVTIPKRVKGRNHIYHLYTIKINRDYPLARDELFQKLHKYGIGASVHYYPLHLMSYNKKHYRKSYFPNSNKLKDQIISLPIFPTMSEKQLNYVISVLKP